MTCQSNLTALGAARHLGIVTNGKVNLTRKLSSGFKINSAADDAAGLSISEKLRRQIRGLGQAADNIQEGIGYCQVAEGALGEVHDMLHRMTELSVKAANGTNTDEDREDIDDEVQQLKKECERIFTETAFNDRKVWEGTYHKVITGVQRVAAVRTMGTSRSSDVTLDNYDMIPYGSFTLHADETDGVNVTWTDYNGTSHQTDNVSWSTLARNNYRFDIGDYFKASDTDLFDAGGNPVFRHTVRVCFLFWGR